MSQRGPRLVGQLIKDEEGRHALSFAVVTPSGEVLDEVTSRRAGDEEMDDTIAYWVVEGAKFSENPYANDLLAYFLAFCAALLGFKRTAETLAVAATSSLGAGEQEWCPPITPIDSELALFDYVQELQDYIVAATRELEKRGEATTYLKTAERLARKVYAMVARLAVSLSAVAVVMRKPEGLDDAKKATIAVKYLSRLGSLLAARAAR